MSINNLKENASLTTFRKMIMQYLMESGSYFVNGGGRVIYVALLYRSVSQQEIEGALPRNVRELVSVNLCSASLTKYDNQRGDTDCPLHYVKITINK